MDNINKNVSFKQHKNRVIDKLKGIKKTFEYRGEKLNYGTLVNSTSQLLNSTWEKERQRFFHYTVGNRGYKLEVVKKPIIDNITLYKKSEKFDINLFEIEFKYDIKENRNNLFIINGDNFFKETNINKNNLEKDINLIYHNH